MAVMEQMYQILVGNILRARRQELNKTQRDIAKALEYPNPNFVSYIETGKISIPIEKVSEVVQAYQLPGIWVAVIVFFTMTPYWNLFIDMLVKGGKDLLLECNKDDVEKILKKALADDQKAYRVSTPKFK